MSNRRKNRRPGSWKRPYWAPRWAPGPVYHVVVELRDGTLAEFDLDARVHGWLCATCGAVDPGEDHAAPCGHDAGHCTERVLAAAALRPPGTVLVA